MKNVCFSIPIHEPNYIYIDNLIELVNKTKIQVFLITSNFDLEFEKKFSKYFIFINISKIYRNNITNWPTQKKFIANKFIFDNYNYEYIVSCDSEIKLERTFNEFELMSICENYFLKKHIYGGGRTEDQFIEINQDCIQFLASEEKLNYVKDIYFWFTHLPIYERKSFLHFYDENNIENKIYKFNHFDYIIYSYWLVLKYNFKIINWNNLEYNQKVTLNYSGEMFHDRKLLKLLIKHGFKPNWLSENYSSHLKFKSVILRYHLDRFKFQKSIFSKFKVFIKKVLCFKETKSS
jgi:hypothetical protein